MAFFWWQVAINTLNTGVLVALLWKCLPGEQAPRFRLETLRSIRRFAAGITGVAVVSMLLGDLDKIVVSKMLPLQTFGYYSLAWRIALTLSFVSGPVFAAVFPAFSRHVGVSSDKKLAEVYHRGAQLMSLLVIPPALTIVFFARPIIFGWTGSALTAGHTYLLTALLTGGTAFNCFVSIPFALQLAYGWTSLAFYANLTSTLLIIPLLFFLTRQFGAAGAASIWLVTNISFLVSQVAIMHYRLLPGERRNWFLRDLGFPLLTGCSIAFLIARFTEIPSSRIGALLHVGTAGMAIGAAASFANPLAIKQIRRILLPARQPSVA